METFIEANISCFLCENLLTPQNKSPASLYEDKKPLSDFGSIGGLVGCCGYQVIDSCNTLKACPVRCTNPGFNQLYPHPRFNELVELVLSHLGTANANCDHCGELLGDDSYAFARKDDHVIDHLIHQSCFEKCTECEGKILLFDRVIGKAAQEYATFRQDNADLIKQVNTEYCLMKQFWDAQIHRYNFPSQYLPAVFEDQLSHGLIEAMGNTVTVIERISNNFYKDSDYCSLMLDLYQNNGSEKNESKFEHFLDGCHLYDLILIEKAFIEDNFEQVINIWKQLVKDFPSISSMTSEEKFCNYLRFERAISHTIKAYLKLGRYDRVHTLIKAFWPICRESNKDNIYKMSLAIDESSDYFIRKEYFTQNDE